MDWPVDQRAGHLVLLHCGARAGPSLLRGAAVDRCSTFSTIATISRLRTICGSSRRPFLKKEDSNSLRLPARPGRAGLSGCQLTRPIMDRICLWCGNVIILSLLRGCKECGVAQHRVPARGLDCERHDVFHPLLAIRPGVGPRWRYGCALWIRC